MWGQNSGSFVISAQQDFTTMDTTPLFMRNGSQSYNWIKKDLTISKDVVLSDFKLAIDVYLLQAYGEGIISNSKIERT